MLNRFRKLILIGVLLSATADAKEPKRSSDSSTTASDEPLSRQEIFEINFKSHSRTSPSLEELAIPNKFLFPDNADRRDAIFGIDVDHYTEDGGILQLEVLRQQKVEFIYMKATQGIGFKDKAFPAYWQGIANLKSEKPLRGAYCFLSSISGTGKQQAKYFFDYVGHSGGIKNDDLPPCVDLEEDRDSYCVRTTCGYDKDCIQKHCPDRWKKQSPDQIFNTLTEWLRTTEELTHRTPALYTRRSWWIDCKIPVSRFAALNKYPIWIADYREVPRESEKPDIIGSRSQTLWQFAEDARLSIGYPKKLDASVFYGSRKQFGKALGVSR